jgi:hypothetical protein
MNTSRVYAVQCRTFKVLLDLLNIPHSTHEGGIATQGDHPIAYFRLVPAYRCAYSKALRKRVADAVRVSRRTR